MSVCAMSFQNAVIVVVHVHVTTKLHVQHASISSIMTTIVNVLRIHHVQCWDLKWVKQVVVSYL